MGLPFAGSHGGQILFNREDGYLYFMMGDGGGKDDPFNFAQNKKSLLGKIMRLDVNNIPSKFFSPRTNTICHKNSKFERSFMLIGKEEIADLGLWGNYSIPRDNPYSQDQEMEPEIWAMGLRNPWRCSFDSERPSYFFCADIGQVAIHPYSFFPCFYDLWQEILATYCDSNPCRTNMKRLISSPKEEIMGGVLMKVQFLSKLKKSKEQMLLLILLI